MTLLDERELREHHEIAGTRERLAETPRLGVVVPDRRGAVHEHHRGMPLPPPGPPPGDPHLDVGERLGRIAHSRPRGHEPRGVVPVERAGVDVDDEYRARARRTEERSPKDDACDEEPGHDDAARHATTIRGRRAEPPTLRRARA